MDIKNFNWQLKKEELKNSLQEPQSNLDYVYGKCLFWGKDCFATFYFNSSDIITKVGVAFYKPSGVGTEAIDYKKTFNTLKEVLGEPQEYININTIQLEKLKDVYTELKYDNLPRIIWNIEEKRIVHRFKDYWGMVPDTYVEKVN